MKKLLLLIVSVSCLSSCLVQTPIESPPPKTANFENKLSLTENYVRANEWMVETFNDAESVIQFSDKESGIVKGKYVMRKGYVSTNAYIASTDPLYAIITIRVKDNAYRIEVDSPSGMYIIKDYVGEQPGFTPAKFDKAATELIASFEKRMSGSGSKDW